MPRLQILQHKSYHPYLEKNKQRVREDEAKAAAEEAERERKRVDAEAEARLDILRRRAGSPTFAVDPSAARIGEVEDELPSTSTSKDRAESLLEKHRKAKLRAEKLERRQKERLDFDFPSASTSRSKDKGRDGRRVDSYDTDENGREAVGWQVDGHVNLFADLERNEPKPTLDSIAKGKQTQKEDPFTMYLSRPERETKPWYTDRELKRVDEKDTGEEAEERRRRDKRKDERSKNRNDPLTQITSMLSSSKSSQPKVPHRKGGSTPSDPVAARVQREQSERQRALALIAKSKVPSWDDTPSTVGLGRSWADSLERQKERAGMRFYGGNAPSYEGRDHKGGRDGGWGGRSTGRSWEV